MTLQLKSRLVKPSIVLPLGKYLAGVHHLRLVQCTFGKEQHGLRERDIYHKDKQNYDAIMHMTSKACMALLSQIPDAKGTHEVIRCVIDSFLDKDLDASSRVEKVCSLLYALLAPVVAAQPTLHPWKQLRYS